MDINVETSAWFPAILFLKYIKKILFPNMTVLINAISLNDEVEFFRDDFSSFL